MRWDVCFKAAIKKDGSLLYPERLSSEFLQMARRNMGSVLFTNQYMNRVLDEETQPFKKTWFRYYDTLPTKLNIVAFIDPAISQNASADNTGIVVVGADSDDNRYCLYAARKKLTPTQIVEACFLLHKNFKPQCIGIETIAFQEALLYMIDQESRRRGVILPMKGVKHGSDERKEQRIMGLVPYFEWSRYYLKPGLVELEDELLTFPRGAHDDVIDALASVEKIIIRPEKEIPSNERPNPADAKSYESWYRRQLVQKGSRPTEEEYGE